MKNSEKNSRKSNLFSYFLIFSLLFSLIFGGIYLYYTEEERQLSRILNWVKDEKDFEYKELDNNSIVSYNERNIQDKQIITKELNYDVNLKPKVRGKLKQVLEGIQTIDSEIDSETLEKKSSQERKEIIRKVLIIRTQLGKLISSIKKLKKNETKEDNYLKEQEEWTKKFYPSGFSENLSESEQSEEDKEVRKELNRLIKIFFNNFIREEKLPKAKTIQLARTKEGEELPFETSEAEIARITSEAKNKFPTLNFDTETEVEFLGFTGWHGEKNKEKGTTTAGLTIHTKSKKLEEDDRFEKIPWKREISITLHKNLPFGRKGKEYNKWWTEKNGSNFIIGWDNLIETIAHELAHAVINYNRVYYRAENDEKGGHGILHRQYTMKMKSMIKKMPEYREFKNWWFLKK